MKKKVTHKEISDLIGKNEQTIKGWKSRFPELLEIVKLGSLCKINNLDEEKIIKLIELEQIIKNSD